MTSETIKDPIQIESLETLPADATLGGSLALVRGELSSVDPSRLAQLAHDFDCVYLVANADAVELSGIDGIATVSKFAAIGFDLGVEAALAIADTLINLDVLYLDDNRIAAAGLRTITEMGSLTSLHVANNGVGRAIAALSDLWQLKELDLSRNSLGGKKVLPLRELRNLERLSIDSCHLYAPNLHFLPELTNLQILSIADNNISDEDAAVFAEMPTLTELNVTGNRLTKDGLAVLTEIGGLSVVGVDQQVS